MDVLQDKTDVEEALISCAERNFSYKEMSSYLLKSYNIHISANAIGKRLRRLGFLSRRGTTLHGENEVKRAIEVLQFFIVNSIVGVLSYRGFQRQYIDPRKIVTIIAIALVNLPKTVGYRTMTNILRRKGMHCRRDAVMKMMKVVDPEGVHFRRRRRIQRRVYRSLGPNHVWHVDGYDKLKPFGLAIHGCIDGYSRKIMWLNVGPSNNNPKIAAANFVLCVKKMKGCPLVLQTDPGTENVIMGALQCVFRHDADDCFSGINSFRVVRSVFNQRIEAWWSMLRRRQTQSWIHSLQDLESIGLFHRGNTNETYCLRYCLMPFVAKELQNIAEEWNGHYVSLSRTAVCPNGRPDVLHSLCEHTGGMDCIQSVTEEDLEWAMSECQLQCRSGSLEFDDLALEIFEQNGWSDAFSWQGSIDNYIRLLNACS